MDRSDDSRMRPGRVRQLDIARAAGVSQTAVSMALAGGGNASVPLALATRQHILRVAGELGYSVNPVARSLAGGRNRLLGVYTFEAMFPIAAQDFYQPFLFGIEQEAERTGYDLLLFTSASMSGQRRSIYAGGVNRLGLADGSILLGRRDNKSEIARLVRAGFPFVYVGRREVAGADFSYVTGDYAEATGRVVEHLAGLGHRKIAYLGVPRPREPDRDREQGWSASLQMLGYSSSNAVVKRPAVSRSLSALMADLRGDFGMTALIVEKAEFASRVFEAARELGLSVPEDLSIAVLGDDSSGAASGRAWSGFHIPREEIGRRAVRLLLEAVEGPAGPARHVIVPCLFVPGDTVAAPARTSHATTRLARVKTSTTVRETPNVKGGVQSDRD